MSTLPQVQTKTFFAEPDSRPRIRLPAPRSEPPNLEPWTLSSLSPATEARALFRMVGRNGDTVETLRALIAVPPKIEAILRAYARYCPEEAPGIQRVLRFRRSVGREFERLVSDSRAPEPQSNDASVAILQHPVNALQDAERPPMNPTQGELTC